MATSPASEIVALFKQLDSNGAGTLQAKNMNGVLMGLGLTEKQCQRLYLEAGVYQDGLIRYKELLEWIFVKDSPPHGRAFTSAAAKGGDHYVAANAALLLIEYQNEFTTEGGKLHDAVKDVMHDTSMLENTTKLCAEARAKGAKIFHAPITFKKDMSDNPNKRLGILKGCADGGLFVENTWHSAICDVLAPQEGDIFVSGKKGLDAFPGTNLEELLLKHDVHTIAVAGFLTNCCVESTVRTACEKGFNVVSLIDCTACTSAKGQKLATEGTLGMFSAPMTSTAFLKALK